MKKFDAGKVSILALAAGVFMVLVILVLSQTSVLANHDDHNDDWKSSTPVATPTPTATPHHDDNDCKDHKDRDDCKDHKSPTPTPTEKPCHRDDHKCKSPTPTPSSDPCAQFPNDVCPTPTPASTPGDVCTNIDGFQSTPPDGWYQVSPDNTNCRQFQYGGPESSHQDNPGSPATGSGTGGQVLGASTMAGTGSFDETLYQAIMSVGATISAFGIKSLKKVKKVIKK